MRALGDLPMRFESRQVRSTASRTRQPRPASSRSARVKDWLMVLGMPRVATLLILLALAAGESLAASRAKTEDEMTPVLASVLATPARVRQTDGLLKVVYELELTNVTDAPMTIESVEVRAPQR